MGQSDVRGISYPGPYTALGVSPEVFPTRLNVASNRLSDGTRASNIVASADIWKYRLVRERSRKAKRAGRAGPISQGERRDSRVLTPAHYRMMIGLQSQLKLPFS